MPLPLAAATAASWEADGRRCELKAAAPAPGMATAIGRMAGSRGRVRVLPGAAEHPRVSDPVSRVTAGRSVPDREMLSTAFVLFWVSVLVQQPAASAPIKFEPAHGVPTFAVREPVLRVKPGDIVETRTFSKPGDYYERAGGAWPGEVGPFHIEGATADDTLVVRILKLRPNRDTAV